jgi:hypothetical protein
MLGSANEVLTGFNTGDLSADGAGGTTSGVLLHILS